MNLQRLKDIHDELDNLRKELVAWNADTVDRDSQFRVDIWLDDATEHIHLAEKRVIQVINFIERK